MRPDSRRQAQFFIITAVLISGSLLFITSMFTSTADVDYTDVLSRHDTAVMENIAHRVESAWWDTRWLYRTTVTVRERSGEYLENQAVHAVVPIKRRHVNNDCSDIRVVTDERPVPWNTTTGCRVEIYSSDSIASARYRFDEGYGQWANDSTGNEYHAQRGGSPAVQSADPAWSPGKYRWGLSFDGTDDYLGIPVFYSSPPRATYMYWAYFPDTSQQQYVQTLQTGTAGSSPVTGISHQVNPDGAGNDVIRIVHWTSSGPTAVGDVTVTPGQWNHIAHTTIGNDAMVYVNGEEALSGSGSRGLGSAPATAGTGNGQYWEGKIDDLRIYNTSLTADQVRGAYQNGIGVNISADLAPEEEKTYYVYHGNLFANITQYNSSFFNQPTIPQEPAVVNVDPTRSQNEILKNIKQNVERLDRRISSNIDLAIDADSCAQITFRSQQSNLRMNVC
jgi:hypothetical protein